jgi:aryl-alcohol dehydrogenase-like predicted oxidoreductase
MRYRQLGASGLRVSVLAMGTMTFGGKGVLQHRVDRPRRGKAPDRPVHGGRGQPPVRDQDKLYDVVDVLVDVAQARGTSPAQVALAWLLDRPAVTSVIIGARTEQQLADNLGAADLSLTQEEQARLEAVSRPPLLYPYWHQAKTASDRLGAADLSLLGPYLAT